jgi:NTP pyrophosphatase (non-canonical NTP hydrolase)
LQTNFPVALSFTIAANIGKSLPTCRRFTSISPLRSTRFLEFILSQPDISLRDFQKLIHTMYYEKDAERGVSGTFMWLMEEIGELASALRSNHDRANLEEEFADVVAWLTTIANVAGVDLSAAIAAKYGSGCPGCKKLACDCPMSEKP